MRSIRFLSPGVIRRKCKIDFGSKVTADRLTNVFGGFVNDI